MVAQSAVNKIEYTLEEAVQWLNDVLGYMTEYEQERVATPNQIESIIQLAEKASLMIESCE